MNKPVDDWTRLFEFIAWVMCACEWSNIPMATEHRQWFWVYLFAGSAIVMFLLSLISRYMHNRRYLQTVCLLLIVPFVGCEGRIESRPATLPANEHSVLVLPAEVEERIAKLESASTSASLLELQEHVADLESSVAELQKPLNAPTSSPAVLQLQEEVREHQLKLKALEAKSHQHEEELPCPPKHGDHK